MIHETALVGTREFDDSVSIGEFAVVREGVHIGRNVVIHPHVVIETGVIVEDEVEVFPGALIGRRPTRHAALSRQPQYAARVIVGAGTSVGSNATIYYDVTIGTQTLIGDGASIREQCRIGSRCVIARHVTINYNTTVGDDSKIMDLTHVTGNCTTGRNVFISLSVGMANDTLTKDRGYDADRVVGPTIKDGAVIGAGAILLPAIVVGENAVVSAGSVVNRDVEPATVVAGMPARRVRSAD